MTDVETGNSVPVAIYRGDTLRLTVALTDVAAAPVDVTGWGWRCQVRTLDGGLTGALDVAETDPTAGEVELSMDETETALMNPADYRFDLEATDTTDTVRTLLTGKIRVREDVTR